VNRDSSKNRQSPPLNYCTRQYCQSRRRRYQAISDRPSAPAGGADGQPATTARITPLYSSVLYGCQ